MPCRATWGVSRKAEGMREHLDKSLYCGFYRNRQGRVSRPRIG